jgi:GNAT superfamily N-acetyltransferase
VARRNLGSARASRAGDRALAIAKPTTMNAKKVQPKPFGTRNADEPKIVTATGSDELRAVSTLVIAFAADPAARWLYPRAEQYLEHFPQFVRAFGGQAFSDGTADCFADFCGVALWFAPRTHPDEAAVGGVLEQSVDRGRLPEIFTVLEQMGRFHPSEPHWYLPLIGVDPSAQNRGLGQALLRRALARCDRERVPAYLESTSTRNAPLYERFGFKAIGRIQTPNSPPIIPMVRPAQ